MSETDGMDDAVETGLRAGLMAATRIGEQLARMREQALREMRQAEEQNARELQERFDTAQVTARAQLAPVSRDDWWNHATPEMIGQAHETATAWKDHDHAAAGHAERIRDQVQQRYGIDINNLAPGEFDIFEAAARAQNTAGRAPVEQPGKTPARTDEATASAVMNSADREERANAAAAASAGPGFDTPVRREKLAQSLDGKADREAVNVRLLADKHQGTHPHEAVRTSPSTAEAGKAGNVLAPGRTMEYSLER